MNTITKARVCRTLLAMPLAAMLGWEASAAELNLWVRESASDAGQLMVDLWNSGHEDQITLTAIPDNQMVTKLATSIQGGDAPDLVSFDLIYMPDFMRAGFLVDVTDQLSDDPNYANHIDAYKNLAVFEDRIYGIGFTPEVSVLIRNKELFRQAGLDPERGPTSLDEIVSMARQIGSLGDDTYGFYFSGSCAGCNIFVTSPLMVAGGGEILPRHGEDAALEGDAIPAVLNAYKTMWEEGLVPESAEVDTGANFASAFLGGNIGMAGTGGFAISLIQREFPELDYGLSLLPGLEPGQVSSFVGGDVAAIPKGGPNEAAAREFLSWVLSDEAQLEGLAKNSFLSTRTDLAGNEYAQDPRVQILSEALAAGYVPWVFHYNDMANSDNSPWNIMIQSAIFDDNVEGAIEEAREEMLRIASE